MSKVWKNGPPRECQKTSRYANHFALPKAEKVSVNTRNTARIAKKQNKKDDC